MHDLIKSGFAVLFKYKNLLIFPFLSIVINGLILYFMYEVYLQYRTPMNARSLLFWFMIAYYFISVLVGTFFSSGLIFCTYHSLLGKSTTVSKGFKNSLGKLNKIFYFAIMDTLVLLLLSYINKYTRGWFGKILLRISRLAYDLMTLLIVPVIVLEDKGLYSSAKRSALLFKKKWKTTGIAILTLGIWRVVVFLLIFPLIFIMAEMGFSEKVTYAVVIIYFLFFFVFNSAIKNIIFTALYIYSAKNKVPRLFTAKGLNNAFSTDGERRKYVSAMRSKENSKFNSGEFGRI